MGQKRGSQQSSLPLKLKTPPSPANNVPPMKAHLLGHKQEVLDGFRLLQELHLLHNVGFVADHHRLVQRAAVCRGQAEIGGRLPEEGAGGGSYSVSPQPKAESQAKKS